MDTLTLMLKRGTKVKVVFEGIIINSWSEEGGGYQISVKNPSPPKKFGAWWAVVPPVTVEELDA